MEIIMRILKLVMFTLYRYYSKGGTRRIPYVSALLAVVFLIYLHIFQVLIIFNKVDLLPMRTEQSQIIKYYKLAIFLLPIVLTIGFLVKEKDLRDAEYDDELINRTGKYLVLYAVLSVILLFVLMFVAARR